MKKLTLLIILIIGGLSSCYITKKATDYYGVEMNDHRYVFLIDISGSMENIIERDAKGQVITMAENQAIDYASSAVGGQAGAILNKSLKKSMTKLQKAKKKIIPVINGFSEDNYFDIITFENDVKMWRKTPVQATSANKKLAVAYIESLKAGGGTNISDALRKALKLAGEGTQDSTKALNVETIFLLTDGVPSAGQYTNTEEILSHTEEWNKLKRVKINAVGLGDDQDKIFMKKLAEENNGVYIDK